MLNIYEELIKDSSILMLSKVDWNNPVSFDSWVLLTSNLHYLHGMEWASYVAGLRAEILFS